MFGATTQTGLRGCKLNRRLGRRGCFYESTTAGELLLLLTRAARTSSGTSLAQGTLECSVLDQDRIFRLWRCSFSRCHGTATWIEFPLFAFLYYGSQIITRCVCGLTSDLHSLASLPLSLSSPVYLLSKARPCPPNPASYGSYPEQSYSVLYTI